MMHLRIWLLLIFVLSGFSGLIYQSAWSHYLGLWIGHAAYAQALVLALFMGGMAIGAAWIARVGQHQRNLIRTYAIIEAVIGVFGLFFHWIFVGVMHFGYDILLPAVSAPLLVDLSRWSLGAFLILPQTILLGMTFPLMSGGVIRRFPGADGNALGGLYFTNSIGAAFGALVSAFALLPWFGLPGTMTTAAIINLLVAALAFWLAREPEPVPTRAHDDNNHMQNLAKNNILRVVLLSTAISGAASFAYEIIWIRMLSMAVGSTMHAFELMLASFVAGIAFGGLWIRRRADYTSTPLRLAGWMQIGMGIAALASLAVYANAFSWVGWMFQALGRSDGSYALYNLGTATIAIAIMLPAAFFAGTTLPLFTVTLLRNGCGERSIGRVYAWNTVGAIFGVFLTIHFLIPTLGLKLALCVAALVDIGIGLVLLRRLAENNRQMGGFALAGVMALLVVTYSLNIPYNTKQLASGVYRHGISAMDDNYKILSYRDGKTASVAVVQAGNDAFFIATNGKSDASIRLNENLPPMADEATMVLAAGLPLAMHDDPQRVAVIGFGSGLTTHSFLGDERIKQVDTIEIEKEMVEGAKYFDYKVERAFNDPRSNIIIDDAKSHFAALSSENLFDIIISEPSNPWISGVGALFSKEFYQFIPRYLKEDGIFLQWVQLYEINDDLVASIFKSLVPNFSDYAAYLSNSGDMLIVAKTKGKLPPLDFSRLKEAAPLMKEMKRLGIFREEHLNFRKLANSDLLRSLASTWNKYEANSDYSLLLGLNAPRTRFRSEVASVLKDLPVLYSFLLETLDIKTPLNRDLEIADNLHYPGDILTMQARIVEKELRLEDNDIIQEYEFLIKSLSDERCVFQKNEISGNRWAEVARVVFEKSVPYLSSESLEGVWIRPNWMRCKDIKRGYSDVLYLLESHAKRDYAQMEILGHKWLNSKNDDEEKIGHLYREFDQIALLGILFAQVKQKRWDEIEATIEGKKVAMLKPYEDQVLLIKGLAHYHMNRNYAK